jgi:hypothetical protein
MKTRLALASLLLLLLAAGGCASGAPSSSGSGSPGARCLSRPDLSGTQPMFYFLCIQSG